MSNALTSLYILAIGLTDGNFAPAEEKFRDEGTEEVLKLPKSLWQAVFALCWKIERA